ncbi:major paralogous domain-containing protein [Fibrobacter sp. UWOV1]|nr:major paralogous domain-containing protein [Fibrobacter sp. UWOV1]
MKYFAALLLSAVLFVACGDDDSSSFVEPEKESSSSEILSSGDGTSDGNGDKSSSSVSSSSTNSSSSAKSSSSVNSSAGGSSAKSSSSGKNTSASSSAGESSSSLSKKYQCLAECTEDCEGETYWIGTDHQMICHGGQWLNLDSMENANRSSSSRYYDMTEQFNPDVEYGEFTDPRDGQKYKTITIDYKYHMRGVDSVTIFAENLNYGEKVSGGTVQENGAKYCYDDDSWYCENGWGGLYTWSNAMGFPAVCDSVSIASEKCPNKFDYSNKNEKFDGDPYFLQHQGICPEGWHIMNEDIWVILAETSGGSSSLTYEMGSKVAYFGSKNKYGMSILPVGYWEHTPSGEEHFTNITQQTLFWLPEQDGDEVEKAHHVNIMSRDMTRGNSRSKYKFAHSIRCVKNY